jgi:hypothetical protein
MENEGLMPKRRWEEHFTKLVKPKPVSVSPIMHNDPHPGFKTVQGKIEGEGYSANEAGAILASKTRNSSVAAKKANPNLKKVKG